MVLYYELGIDSVGSGIMVQQIVSFANNGAPVSVNTVDVCKYLGSIFLLKL